MTGSGGPGGPGASSDPSGPGASSGPDGDPAGALLVAGAVPAGGATGLCALAALGVAGAGAAASTAAGGLLALLAFAAGPLVMRAGRSLSPPGLLAAAVLAYGCVVLLLGVAYAALDRADWFRGAPAGVALLVAGTAWLAGQLHRTRRLRVLIFGSPGSLPVAAPENR